MSNFDDSLVALRRRLKYRNQEQAAYSKRIFSVNSSIQMLISQTLLPTFIAIHDDMASAMTLPNTLIVRMADTSTPGYRNYKKQRYWIGLAG